MIRPNDLVVVIPDYCQLPSPDKAPDIIFKYMHSRPALYGGEYLSYRWNNVRRGALGTCNYLRLFNNRVDIPYFSGGRDLYVMQVKVYESFSKLYDNKLNNVDRYDIYLEGLTKSNNPTIRYRAIEECPFEIDGFQNLYPSVDDIKGWLNGFYGAPYHEENVVHTPDSIVEELKEKVLAEFKVSPFPPYKYDSAAYQKIAASREAMKRAENGESEAEAIIKRSFWDHVDLEQKRLAREYMLNDIIATKELFEIYKKKEENENMKQNNKTTGNAKTLTGYVSDISVTHAPCESYDDSTIEIVLRVPDRSDILSTIADADIKKMIYDHELVTLNFEKSGALKPKKVIFNNPATIVLWNDGTKTVVTRQKGDRYNKEEGLALCYMKKALGNSSRTFNDALHAGLEMGEK